MNKKIISLIVIAVAGVLLTIGVYHSQLMGLEVPGMNNAPQLSDLFADRAEGPHQRFESEQSCLKCHAKPTEIPGMGVAPQIAHEFRRNCTSCHRLPS